MTLDEAIKHAEEVAEEKEKEGKLLCNSEAGSTGCLKCADEHRQLAEWLRDYKRLKEQELLIRKAMQDMENYIQENKNSDDLYLSGCGDGAYHSLQTLNKYIDQYKEDAE